MSFQLSMAENAKKNGIITFINPVSALFWFHSVMHKILVYTSQIIKKKCDVKRHEMQCFSSNFKISITKMHNLEALNFWMHMPHI